MTQVQTPAVPSGRGPCTQILDRKHLKCRTQWLQHFNTMPETLSVNNWQNYIYTIWVLVLQSHNIGSSTFPSLGSQLVDQKWRRRELHSLALMLLAEWLEWHLACKKPAPLRPVHTNCTMHPHTCLNASRDFVACAGVDIFVAHSCSVL